MRKLSGRQYTLPKHPPPKDWRKEYAYQFNTYTHNVFYWGELTSELQDRAKHQFSGLNMADHVYHLSKQTDQPRRIISRIMIAFGDTVTQPNKQLHPNCYPSAPEQLSLIDGPEAD